ncbi:MAG: hypothetical protein K8S13_22685 [Desulfobacula sp.]|nr:hypothetical protein [Desulfobacula sp.]MCD4722638.1 hypothetical protein [Desulfobacula sp.]
MKRLCLVMIMAAMVMLTFSLTAGAAGRIHVGFQDYLSFLIRHVEI